MSIIRTIVAVIIGITLSLFSLGCGSPLVQQLAIPSISQILPQTLSAGSSGATMKVMGSNFTNQTAILWNGSALATTYVDPSTLTVAVTAAQLATPTTVQLQVQNGQTGTASVAVPLAIASPLATSSTLAISSPVLSAGLVGTSYSAIFSASGGTPGYTWSITSGSLPTGLSLASTTGVIAGTPTASGSFTFNVTARDSVKQAQTATVSATIVIVAKSLAIKTTSLAAGTSGTIYSQQLLATGGTPAYTWSITSGSLPAGLSLSATTGVITGTPTVSGTFALGLTVTDSGKPVQTASITTSIVLAPQPLKITTTSLASGIGGTTYSQTLQATGGTPAYTWSLASGSLPTGLTLSTAGVISGTSWASGTFSFGVTVKDSAASAQSVTTAMMITIAPKPLAIKTSAMNAGSAGSYYSQTLAATGGTAPYSWSLSTGTLPPGLSLSTTGVIFGTPTTGGNFDFGLTVTDSSNPQQTSSISTLIVVAPGPLSISTTSLAAANQGVSYSQTLQAAGGTPSYRWSITSGSLPAGLTLSSWTGVISGTPTASGTFTLGVTVQDRGNPQQKVTSTLTLSVIAPAAPPLALGAVNLPSATATLAFSGTLSATGGVAPYTWTISSGQLPTGLSLAASTGAVSGTPTVSGTFTASVTVTDSTKLGQTATESVTIVVAPSPLTILTTTLAPATGGTAYSASLQVSGGTPSYTWTITSGSLPAGLSLASTGVISGTPTATGTFSLGLLVTDKCNPVQSKSVALSLTVNPSALTAPVSALNSGTVGVAYSQALTATGGTPAYTWSITSGSLPAGLTLAASTGVISGTPTTSGTTIFTASVRDNGNPAQTQSLATSIVVAPVATSTGPGTTWYIRADGGSRYSANQPDGQCDGKGDAAYPGTGSNQHCAFNDFRFLWDDQSYNNRSWVIAGGDTVILRGCASNPNQATPSSPDCRIGFDAGWAGQSHFWCYGGDGPYSCYNPTIPAGTSAQHTRILGQNYGSCSSGNVTDRTALSQLFGGFGAGLVLNLAGAKNLDVQCLEITQHNGQCILHGSPAYPRSCNTGSPTLDDYDGSGIGMDSNTSNVLLQDVYIHGHTTSGIAGPIGGLITMNRVFVGFNGFSGWNFDDGRSTPDAPGSSIIANYVTMEGNGCNEEYPIVHTGFPAKSCYDLNSGGFGDSWSGQDTAMDTFTCNHCVNIYNTKDGFIGPHTTVTNLLIENSTNIGNMGQQWKWGGTPNSNTTFINNLTIGNCDRMAEQIPGSAQNFNMSTGLPGSNLSLFCRAAGDVFSFFSNANSTVLIANNTVVSYQATVFDLNCGVTGSCGTTPYIFKNNIFLGYVNNDPVYHGWGAAPGLYYLSDDTDAITASNNIEYGIRNGDTCGTNKNLCLDPLLTAEPGSSLAEETALDNFNFKPTSGSPVIGAGLYLPNVTLDYTGAQRANPPSIGAYEQ